MREGEAALGVWLPLALAVVVKTLRSQWGEDKAKLSDILEWFMLPSLAAAVRGDEEQAEADETEANFEALRQRFGNGKH